MAQVKVYAPTLDVFNPPRQTANGWVESFPIRIHGDDVPEGAAVDIIDVEFLDGDAAFQMDNKIRDAARAKATARGFTVALGGVVSYAPPRRL